MAKRECSVCEHSERHLIEEALIDGESLRGVASRFVGVSRSGLTRHRAHTGAGEARGEPIEDLQEEEIAEAPQKEEEGELDLRLVEIRVEFARLQALQVLEGPGLLAALARLAQERGSLQAEYAKMQRRANEEIPSVIVSLADKLADVLAEGEDPSGIREEIRRLTEEQVALFREISLLPMGDRLEAIAGKEAELKARQETLQEGPGRYLLGEASRLRGEQADLEAKSRELRAAVSQGLAGPHRFATIEAIFELGDRLALKEAMLSSLEEPMGRISSLLSVIEPWGRRELALGLAKNRGGRLEPGDLTRADDLRDLFCFDFESRRWAPNPPSPALELFREMEVLGLGEVDVPEPRGINDSRKIYFILGMAAEKYSS